MCACLLATCLILTVCRNYFYNGLKVCSQLRMMDTLTCICVHVNKNDPGQYMQLKVWTKLVPVQIVRGILISTCMLRSILKLVYTNRSLAALLVATACLQLQTIIHH